MRLETPKLLDLFCGAGGCSVGYERAGFEVTGVDINFQKRYPHPERFIQADAMEYCGEHGHEYDVIHASPPCQCYSIATKSLRNAGKKYPDLVGPTREALKKTGKPYIIENVPGAPLQNYIVLCGLMFDLKVFRHRLFESNCLIPQPAHRSHRGKYIGIDGFLCIVGKQGGQKGKDGKIMSSGTVSQARMAMGIDWMTWRELTQAIPPAYTEYIGDQLFLHL